MVMMTQSQRDEAVQRLREQCCAITGSLASGKSTVRKALQSLGYPAWDADALVHGLLSKDAAGARGIRALFGDDYFDEEGLLRRGALRARIFYDVGARVRLEELMHPLIEDLLLRNVQALDEAQTLFFYEASLVFEKKKEHCFRQVMLVYCHDEDQKQRLRQRLSITWSDAQRVLRVQLPVKVKKRRTELHINTSVVREEELPTFLPVLLAEHGLAPGESKGRH